MVQKPPYVKKLMHFQVARSLGISWLNGRRPLLHAFSCNSYHHSSVLLSWFRLHPARITCSKHRRSTKPIWLDGNANRLIEHFSQSDLFHITRNPSDIQKEMRYEINSSRTNGRGRWCHSRHATDCLNTLSDEKSLQTRCKDDVQNLFHWYVDFNILLFYVQNVAFGFLTSSLHMLKISAGFGPCTGVLDMKNGTDI
jgi:hypothetical protein